MPDLAFLGGRFMPLEQATVSIEDRGYQFGDGIYEVLRTYAGVPFELGAHLQRFERSARAIGLNPPFPSSRWEEIVRDGLRKAAFAESKVYLQLTRGVAPRDHVFPSPTVAPVALMTVRALQPLDPELQIQGVSAMTMEDWRWARCDIKSLNLLPNVLAKQRARENGAFEAIFVRGGAVTEGAVSNVMIVTAGRLVTPPEGHQILSGVTRAVVLDLARKAGIPVEERPVAVSELREAEEIVLTGTTIEVLPVVRIDGTPVGRGVSGAVARELLQRFRQYTTGATRPA